MSKIKLLTADELATTVGFESNCPAFRHWCNSLNITPVPGRRNAYDPALVRRRLDEAQGLAGQTLQPIEAIDNPGPLTPMEQRRLRKAMEAEEAQKK